jgi:hypothetical protein
MEEFPVEDTADPDAVFDRESFANFVYHLRDDWEANRTDATKATYWQNPDMPHFLDSMGYWVRHEMSEMYERQGIEMPPNEFFEHFANLLFVAAIYE